MALDISNFSKYELETLHVEADKALRAYKEIWKRQAIVAAEEALQKYGFSLQDLTERRSRGRRKATFALKYSNRGEPQITWSGRGRRPPWPVIHPWLAVGLLKVRHQTPHLRISQPEKIRHFTASFLGGESRSGTEINGS